MKAILYVVALLVAGGAAYFTLEHSRKFEELETHRIKTIADNKAVSANADVKEKELKDEKGVLASSKDKREILTQSISALKSTAAALERDVAGLDSTIKGQKEEFEEVERTRAEVAEILKGTGEDVTIETLPQMISQINEDKKALIIKLDELEILATGAEKQLANSRAEFDRLVKRDLERSARISRNSMESVITAVNQDWGFLVIGAGSNSGFTPQTGLIVQRDGRMIGRVRPSSIEPTQTIAEIDFKSLASGVRLQPGDRVMLATPITN